MDDIDQVTQILQLLKDIKQGEIHIDNGEMKLSVWKGVAGGSAEIPEDFARECIVAPSEPVEQEAVSTMEVKEDPKVVGTATEAEKKEETIEEVASTTVAL